MLYLCTVIQRERGRNRGMAMAKRAAARRNNIQKTAIKECPIRTAPTVVGTVAVQASVL